MIIDYDFWFSGSYSARKVKKFIRRYYSYIAVLLYRHKLIQAIPDIEFTNAKTYYGRIVEGKDFCTIKISDWNTLNPYWDYDDFMEEITDTICHEPAHLLVWEHGKEHDDTTENIKIFAINTLEIERIKYKKILCAL